VQRLWNSSYSRLAVLTSLATVVAYTIGVLTPHVDAIPAAITAAVATRATFRHAAKETAFQILGALLGAAIALVIVSFLGTGPVVIFLLVLLCFVLARQLRLASPDDSPFVVLTAEPVKKEVLAQIEDTLRTEFMANLARTSKRDSHEMMAEIFNNFDRSTEGRFMSALEERNRDSAEKIKSLMFTFEDLVRLDPNGVQVLLRTVDKGDLATALKGASDSLKDLFLSNMSERAAKILREDMNALGPVRLKDVDEAQMEMVNLAKDLAAKGEIIISEGGAEDELIY